MKKRKIPTFLQGKGFYMSLLAGVLAVFVIAMVYFNISSINKSNRELVDLNEPVTDVADGTEEQNQSSDYVTIGDNSNNEVDEDISIPGGTEVTDDPVDVAEAMSNANVQQQPVQENQADVSNTNNEPATPVMNNGETKVQDLSFDEEAGLLWPVKGNIIKEYSTEKLVFFETLGQYKWNPSIVIDCEVDTDVLCATKGIVTEIEQKDETGLTITMEIGNGYELTYGQLKEEQVEVGDMIEEGELLGSIAEPSSYFAVEGSNLFFQIMQDGEYVNPMLLLR